MIQSCLAPAKVNLFLHVGPVQAEGYHPLSSLMVFADIGDVVSLASAETTSFEIVGRFAQALASEDPQCNLALRAVHNLLHRTGGAPAPFRLVLDKALPVASGLGGGSSDAGAALRLARTLFAPGASDGLLEELALALGSDGPACLHARAVLAEGRGERLSVAPGMPPLAAVLVNPGVACPTSAVYRAYDLHPRAGGEALPPLPARFASTESVFDALRAARNDLEAPAVRVAPIIDQALALLRSAPETALARLSGSGATCFALCENMDAAGRLAQRIEAVQPHWWVRTCRLGTADHEAVMSETHSGRAA